MNLLFDLDGTLTNPKEGITKSVAYALRAYGIEVPDLDTLEPFIGPPLADSFVQYYGFPWEQAMAAVDKYREYFSVTGLYENIVYPGIPEMLETLRQRGYQLFVATSKPTVFSVQILAHFGLDRYFSFVAGSELDGRRVRKGDVIRYCIEQNGLTEAVMIGDRNFDMAGARECNIPAVGVTYGFGSREELLESGAVWLADTPAALLTYFQ